MTTSTTLPTAPGFYWWRKHPQDAFIMIGIRQFGDSLSAYDLQTGTFSGHGLDAWSDLAKTGHRQIGEWIAIPPPSELPASNSPLDHQEGGSHYKNMAIQPIEFSTRNRLGFIEGSVIKRMCRHRLKGKAQDIRKAIHELETLLELEYGETVSRSSDTPTPSNPAPSAVNPSS